MEPSTPPRAHSSRDGPATPATPRFGTFEDLPNAEHKQTRTRTPHRRKRSATELATPRQTPHKRKVLITPKQQQLFNKEPELSLIEEDTKHEEAETEAESESESDDGLGLNITEEDSSESSEDEHDSTAASSNVPTLPVQATERPPADLIETQIQSRKHDRIQDSTTDKNLSRPSDKIAEPHMDWGHPHQDKPPPNVPGMWYVFRGKKVFRPLPAGAKPVEPVTLFKKEIDERRRVAESEEDTDVEHTW